MPKEQSRSRRSPLLKSRIKALRNNNNQAEALIWDELKAKRLNGYKFVRQHPIGPYIVDFACRSEKLVVELDGSQHVENRTYDDKRDEHLAEQGYSVLRFWSVDAVRDRSAVLETIVAALEGRLDTFDAPDARFKSSFRRPHET